MSSGGKHNLNNLLTTLPELKKRKVGESNDEEERASNEFSNKGYNHGPIDRKFGQRRAFPINIEIKNIDMNKVPENVDEYLAQVRYEATGFKKESTDGNHHDESDDGSSDDFVYFRKSESEHEKEKEEDDDRADNSLIISQDKIEEYLNEYKKSRNEYSEYRMSITELDAIELPKTAKEWKKFIWEISCEREYVAQIIEEEEEIKLIVYFTKWMGTNLEENYIEWVMGILSAIEEFHDSKELSVIRQLGKRALRQLLANPDSVFFQKIVVIVGDFFKQRDLLRG